MMVDVLTLPENSFGYVPTPALVAPLEFTMTRAEYTRLGGHVDSIRSADDILENGGEYGKNARGIAPFGDLPWGKS